MKRVYLLLGVLLVLLMFLPGDVGAADGYPKGIQVFEAGDHLCVLFENDVDFEIECFCPCEDLCPDPTPKKTPKPTDEPKSTPTNRPPEPSPTDKPDPEPTEKPKCNSGRGNDSEGSPDCDPGNSGGKNQGGD